MTASDESALERKVYSFRPGAGEVMDWFVLGMLRWREYASHNRNSSVRRASR